MGRNSNCVSCEFAIPLSESNCDFKKYDSSKNSIPQNNFSGNRYSEEIAKSQFRRVAIFQNWTNSRYENSFFCIDFAIFSQFLQLRSSRKSNSVMLRPAQRKLNCISCAIAICILANSHFTQFILQPCLEIGYSDTCP